MWIWWWKSSVIWNKEIIKKKSLTNTFAIQLLIDFIKSLSEIFYVDTSCCKGGQLQRLLWNQCTDSCATKTSRFSSLALGWSYLLSISWHKGQMPLGQNYQYIFSETYVLSGLKRCRGDFSGLKWFKTPLTSLKVTAVCTCSRYNLCQSWKWE